MSSLLYQSQVSTLSKNQSRSFKINAELHEAEEPVFPVVLVIEAVFAFHQGVATHQKIVHGGLQGGRIVRPFPADLLFVKDDLHLFHVGSFHLLVAV